MIGDILSKLARVIKPEKRVNITNISQYNPLEILISTTTKLIKLTQDLYNRFSEALENNNEEQLEKESFTIKAGLVRNLKEEYSTFWEESEVKEFPLNHENMVRLLYKNFREVAEKLETAVESKDYNNQKEALEETLDIMQKHQQCLEAKLQAESMSPC